MKSIFVSSTFKDMHAERDMLNIDVFPEISEFVAEYGEDVSFIDLRWGINTQELENDESTHKILSVCLDEIDNSKPYLIAFLGERYGWIPDKRLIEYAVTQKSPEYSYLAEIEKSVTALEIEYGALSKNSSIDHCLFYFREPLPIEKLSQEQRDLYNSEGFEHKKKLDELKTKIIKNGGKIRNYKLDWDEEKKCITGLDELKNQIINDLKELFIKHDGDLKPMPWPKKEIQYAELFFRQKYSCSSSRARLCNEIVDKISSFTENLVIVKGELGYGKSTLLAKLMVELRKQEMHVLPIACGQNKNTSNDIDVWRQIIFYLEEILDSPVHTDNDVKYGPSEHRVNWVKEASIKLSECSKKLSNPIVIMIDGVEKLHAYNDFIASLSALLPMLPQRVVFVLSSANNIEISKNAQDKAKVSVFTLDVLERDEKELVLKSLESLYYKKELVSEVRTKLLSLPMSNNPLYLSVMYQRMIMLDINDFREIIRLGDGLEGQTEYMLRLIENAPIDLDGACAMLMEEAAIRINPELCKEALKLIAVSHGGLRDNDIKGILEKRDVEYNKVDFRRLYKYMRPYFIELSDGRIKFAHGNFKYGIEKLISEDQLKSLYEDIFTYLESLPDNDPVHKSDYAWFAWKCDKKLEYLKRLENYKKYPNPFALISTAQVLLDICEVDKGEWLIETLKLSTEPELLDNLIRKIRIDVYVYCNFSNSKYMLIIPILEQALRSSEFIAHNYHSSDSIFSARALSLQIADIFVECEIYDKAVEYYNKTIEIYDALGKDVNGYEMIYNKIGDVYNKCGKYNDALQYYSKAIESYEDSAKAQGSYFALENLIFNYERLAKYCDTCSIQDMMLKLQNKANDIKELLEQVSKEDGDNIFFKFDFIKQTFDDYMIDAAERKSNGEFDEELECYKSSFELLEKVVLKWNKIDNLKCLAELYNKLAIESESNGDTYLSQECLVKSQKILDCLTNEAEIENQYNIHNTKWQKLNI